MLVIVFTTFLVTSHHRLVRNYLAEDILDRQCVLLSIRPTCLPVIVNPNKIVEIYIQLGHIRNN